MKTTLNFLATMMFLIASIGYSNATELSAPNQDQEITFSQDKIPFLVSVSSLASDKKGHLAIVHHPYSDDMRIYSTRRYKVSWYIENGKLFSNDTVVRLHSGQQVRVTVLDTVSGHTESTTFTAPGDVVK